MPQVHKRPSEALGIVVFITHPWTVSSCFQVSVERWEGNWFWDPKTRQVSALPLHGLLPLPPPPLHFPQASLVLPLFLQDRGELFLTGSRQTYWDTNKSTAPPVYLIQEVPNVRRGAQEPGLRDNQSLETQQSHQGSRSRGIRKG